MQLGSIVAYKSSGKAQLGLISEEKGNKLILRNGDSKKTSINADKVDFVIEQSSKTISDEELKLKYDEFIKNAEKINLNEIYEVVEEEEEGISLKDIADLYFINEYNNQQLFSLYYALSKDNIYFKQKSNNLYIPKKRSEVEDRLNQIKKEEENRLKKIEEKKNNFRRLKNYFNYYYKTFSDEENNKEISENLVDGDNKKEDNKDKKENELTYPPKLSKSLLNMIEPIKQYAIFGEKYENKSEAQELLKEIKKRTPFKMVSSRYESAFKLIQELGIFEEDENLSLLKYNIPQNFDDEILDISKNLDEFHYDKEEEPYRTDLRDQMIYTIDDQETTDIDDGLSIEETDSGYKVYIHIADVSYYIKKDTKLDSEALQRSTTVYLPIGRISMFPERLSENLMSLIEGKDRPAITFVREFDKDLNAIPESDNVLISTINVTKRLSFLEAEGLIIDEEGSEEFEELNPNEQRKKMHKDLSILNKIAEKLRDERIDRGAIDFNTPSVKVKVDDNKNITIKHIQNNLKSNMLVKEMMIVANNIAANFCINNDIPCIFISQPAPDTPLDDFDMKKKLNRKEVYEVLKRMKKSEMGISPAKHTGLGVEAYTQATSPIRRYNDLLVHRQLKSYIINKDNTSYTKEEIQIVAATAENTARETMSIERETRRYWILKYLSNKIGETTTAFVVRKLNVNYKVMLDNTLTSAILVTNEDIEPGYLVDVKIDNVRVRQDNVSVSIAMDT